LGLNYVVDPNTGSNAFEYSVNGQYAASSPGDPYFDLGPGQFVGSPGDILGGYFQIGANPPGVPGNSGSVIFDDITITAVPDEASCFALLSASMMSLSLLPRLLRRRV